MRSERSVDLIHVILLTRDLPSRSAKYNQGRTNVSRECGSKKGKDGDKGTGSRVEYGVRQNSAREQSERGLAGRSNFFMFIYSFIYLFPNGNLRFYFI